MVAPTIRAMSQPRPTPGAVPTVQVRPFIRYVTARPESVSICAIPADGRVKATSVRVADAADEVKI